MSDTKPVLEMRNVDKSFGPIDVLHDISLKVNKGEVPASWATTAQVNQH